MCSTQTVAQLLGGVITSANNFGNVLGLTDNTAFKIILEELNQAEVDVQNWKKGSPAQNIIQILTDVSVGLKPLVPPEDELIANVILAGITTVIGILDGNQSVPTPTGATANDTQIKEHQAEVAMHTMSQVKTLVPGFHYRKGFLGLFRENPEHAYYDNWNEVVKQAGGKWETAHINY